MGASSGCLGLLVVVAAVYFTDAGSWVGRQVNAINDNCYSTLSGLSSDIAGPVCQGVAAGFNAANEVLMAASDQISDVRRRILGDTSFETLDAFASELSRNVKNMASSSTDLSRMLSLGPNNVGSFSSSQSFQNAIDSFAIGQGLFTNPATSSQGIPWLQRGAQQPMGYGVMSQLSLGSLYAKGGQGIPSNPRLATAYLQQASQSISTLSTSNTPQAQQLLKTLPAPPHQMQREIERAVKQLTRGLPH